MTKQGSPEHREAQRQRMKAWFAKPENQAKHSARQKKRFATKKGRAHLSRMGKIAAELKRKNRVIPESYAAWNKKMRQQGIKAAARIDAIRKRMEEEARSYE